MREDSQPDHLNICNGLEISEKRMYGIPRIHLKL